MSLAFGYGERKVIGIQPHDELAEARDFYTQTTVAWPTPL
jgi:hypothetical protein